MYAHKAQQRKELGLTAIAFERIIGANGNVNNVSLPKDRQTVS
jgi:hypothetical protein